MKVDKEYLQALHNFIKATPWRCNDADLKSLLDITETLLWEYEELNKKYLQLESDRIKHTDMLRNQLIKCMSDNKRYDDDYIQVKMNFPG